MRAGLAGIGSAIVVEATLNAMLVDPGFADHIDTSQVMVAGFSYGGWLRFRWAA